MQLSETIQQHLEQLPLDLQTEVLQYILNLEEKHHQQNTATEERALAIHVKLMDQFEQAFEKLAK